MEGSHTTIVKKLPVFILIIFVAFLMTFSTWQLFRGNLEAAFSALPFLLIVYLFLLKRR